jgi:hypothetical protein
MATMEIRDTAIWIKHLEDADLGKHLADLNPGDQVDLEVDGVLGRWERMRSDADGRPSFGMRPIGAMSRVWSRWYQTRRGHAVLVRLPVAGDDWLEAAGNLFPEWASAEDEAAFGDL